MVYVWVSLCDYTSGGLDHEPTSYFLNKPSDLLFNQFFAHLISHTPISIQTLPSSSSSFSELLHLLEMWIPWILRSPTRAQRPPSNFNFRCTSFRDVQSLCDDELSGENSPKPPHSPVHKTFFLRRVRISTSVLRAWSSTLSFAVRNSQIHRRPPPDASNRIVVYFTSLRVVRRTFEDCRTVRSILKSLRVKIDERDLSMDSSFLEELQGIEPLALPVVFIDGKYIGGVEEIRNAHESGDLKRMIERLQLKDPEGVCGVCGGHRFLLCKWCSGSHRVYSEECAGFKVCDACNQNGLIKCPTCTSVVF
ncbi:uncharacterized protein [Phyllobates terribilis]|uniref:uncharacterized protein n=1 Tax=Phyllobates terribilis TaxID=111132 RepID=UPI003CCA821B